MFLLEILRYAAAESDCSIVLALDDRYLKAYLRRGTARLKLGKTDEARTGIHLFVFLLMHYTVGL